MYRYQHNDQQSGFTLLELMIVVAVAGVFLAVAIPAFADLITRNRLTAQTNSVLSALYLARSEAVNRGFNIRVLSNNGTTNWAAGWVVRLDVNSDGVTDAADTVIRNYDAIENGILDGPADGVSEIAYLPSGFLNPVIPVANPPITLTLAADPCTTEKSYRRVISVQLSGLTSSVAQDCP